MKCKTVEDTKQAMLENKEYWQIPYMEFVDDFRYYQDPSLIEKPFSLNDDRFDSLLASTIEYLCDEMNIDIPAWVWEVPPCKDPWFPSGVENLKAIAIAESPAYFRRRKIFVLSNFLSRV